jgi:membrane-associated protease RseP (regulator of RpoE activity)
MVRPLAALILLFHAFAAHAQSGAPEQPVETAGPLAIWIFAILFFGSIAVYVWMTWRGHRKSKGAQHAEPKQAERG